MSQQFHSETVANEIIELLISSTFGLAVLKILIDDIEAKLDSSVFGLEEIKNEIASTETEVGNIEDKLDSPIFGLQEIKNEIIVIDGLVDGLVADIGVFPTANYATLAAYVEDIRTRLIAILADIVTIDGVVDGIAADIGVFPTANYATLAAYVENIRTRLTTIDTEVGAIETKLDTPANFMADVSGIIADIGAFPTVNYADLATYVEDIRTRLIAIIADTATLITSVVPKATDEQGTVTWVTATHGTNEFDISSLFTTPLTGATRRKYTVFLDLTNFEADAAAWTSLLIRVKIEIDGANPRTVDKKDISKTSVAAAEEPGINIDIPPTAKDVQITFELDVALGADQTIPYHVVTEVLE